MASTYLEDAVFRLRPQAIIVSVTSYEARAAGLCERYAKVNSRNRTCHSLIEVFDRLYEASVPEYCAARLIFLDGDALKLYFHGAASCAVEELAVPANLTVAAPLRASTLTHLPR